MLTSSPGVCAAKLTNTHQSRSLTTSTSTVLLVAHKILMLKGQPESRARVWVLGRMPAQAAAEVLRVANGVGSVSLTTGARSQDGADLAQVTFKKPVT